MPHAVCKHRQTDRGLLHGLHCSHIDVEQLFQTMLPLQCFICCPALSFRRYSNIFWKFQLRTIKAIHNVFTLQLLRRVYQLCAYFVCDKQIKTWQLPQSVYARIRHCPVCMNAQISTVLKARDTKFGIQVFVYPTQLQFILNASCHSYCRSQTIICLCMKLYYWLTYSFHFRLWFEYQNITIPRDFKIFHTWIVSKLPYLTISCLYYKQFKDCQHFKILFLL